MSDEKQPKERRRSWHIEHGIPVAFLFAIFLQTVVFVSYTATWKATNDLKIEQLSQTANTVVDLRDRVVRLETGVGTLQKGVDDINRKLDTPRPSGKRGDS